VQRSICTITQEAGNHSVAAAHKYATGFTNGPALITLITAQDGHVMDQSSLQENLPISRNISCAFDVS
jgi:hypothetical protein